MRKMAETSASLRRRLRVRGILKQALSVLKVGPAADAKEVGVGEPR